MLKYCLKLDNYMILFIFMTFVTFICYPVVNILSRKFGKKKAADSRIWTVWIRVFGISVCRKSAVHSKSDIWLHNLRPGRSSTVSAGVIPQAIVADIAESDCIETGENQGCNVLRSQDICIQTGAVNSHDHLYFTCCNRSV